MGYKLVKTDGRGEQDVYYADTMEEMARYLNQKTGAMLDPEGFDLALGGDDFEL